MWGSASTWVWVESRSGSSQSYGLCRLWVCCWSIWLQHLEWQCSDMLRHTWILNGNHTRKETDHFLTNGHSMFKSLRVVRSAELAAKLPLILTISCWLHLLVDKSKRISDTSPCMMCLEHTSDRSLKACTELHLLGINFILLLSRVYARWLCTISLILDGVIEMEPGRDFWPMTRPDPMAFDSLTLPDPVSSLSGIKSRYVVTTQGQSSRK